MDFGNLVIKLYLTSMYFSARAFDTFLCSHRQQIQPNGSFLELHTYIPENSKRLLFEKHFQISFDLKPP